MTRGILALVLSVALAGSAAAGTLKVTGRGEASAVPDMATMSLGVRYTDRRAADAMDRVARDSNAILAKLRKSGLEEKDIQTSSISLSGNWDYDSQRVTGFTASASLLVILRDLERLGEVLATVTEVGGNNFGGFSLGLQDSEALQAEARAAAVADAMEKARQYAEAAGVELAEILTIREGGNGGRVGVPVMAMEARSSVTPIEIAAGETTVSQSVTLEIEFK